MLMFSLEYKRIFAILSGSNPRDVNVTSSGMTDKTIGKFYSVVAFVKLVFNKHSRIRDYGLNARGKKVKKKTIYKF